MARRSSIEKLPEDAPLAERALTESGFSGYNELESLLRERGLCHPANPLSIVMVRKLSAAMALSVQRQKQHACRPEGARQMIGMHARRRS